MCLYERKLLMGNVRRLLPTNEQSTPLPRKVKPQPFRTSHHLKSNRELAQYFDSSA